MTGKSEPMPMVKVGRQRQLKMGHVKTLRIFYAGRRGVYSLCMPRAP